MISYSVENFKYKLQQWACGFAEANSLVAPTYHLPTNFHPDEATGFLRAIDMGIVIVDRIGRCKLPGLHRMTTKPTEPCLFSLKWGKQDGVYLAWREYITQVGAVASLILDYGWSENMVALDPKDWTFDLAVYLSPDKDAAIHIAGETKKSVRELQRMLDVLIAAGHSGTGPDHLTSLDGHKKYRGLLKERPDFFWAVAPGLRRAFRVTYTGEQASVQEVEDIPKSSYQL